MAASIDRWAVLLGDTPQVAHFRHKSFLGRQGAFLIVSVEMIHVGLVAKLHSLEKLPRDVWISRGSDEIAACAPTDFYFEL